ncbi:MAG TPA: hypothetical protein VGI16_11330 [Candidatus Acidoferrum sp.]
MKIDEQKQRAIDAELKSWLVHVIVPAMVDAYLAEQAELNLLANAGEAVPKCETAEAAL